jgi:hypothetical protein
MDEIIAESFLRLATRRGVLCAGSERLEETGSRAPALQVHSKGAAMVCRKCENLFMSRASTGVPKCANEGFRGGY